MAQLTRAGGKASLSQDAAKNVVETQTAGLMYGSSIHI
jgi:hypothetical protein